jgi:hypothetical protein
MDKMMSYFIVMALALLAVAIAYRVHFLHKLVFGRGSAHLNRSAELAVAPGVAS